MRLALISDIHANDVAFEAVIEDIRRSDIHHLACLGDVATLGPSPGSVLRRLRELGCPCIMGNHDDFLLHRELIHDYTQTKIIVEAVNWCRDQLTRDELEFIETFEPMLEMPLGDAGILRLFHGSPRSHMDDLLATTPVERMDELLSGQSAAVMACGHTHIQMLRQHRGTLVVNPGSVGMPFKEYVGGGPPTLLEHAEYATIEENQGNVAVTLHRVRVDREALERSVRASTFPLRDMVLHQKRRG